LYLRTAPTQQSQERRVKHTLLLQEICPAKCFRYVFYRFVLHNLTSNTYEDEDPLLSSAGARTATVSTTNPRFPLEIADSEDDDDSDDNCTTGSTKTSQASKSFAASSSTLPARIEGAQPATAVQPSFYKVLTAKRKTLANVAFFLGADGNMVKGAGYFPFSFCLHLHCY
jgi:hypothetical protein